MMNIQQGSRVAVFDPRLYVDDVVTPLSHTMRSATVLRVYLLSDQSDSGESDEVADVRFDYDGHESKAHFTAYMKEASEATV